MSALTTLCICTRRAANKCVFVYLEQDLNFDIQGIKVLLLQRRLGHHLDGILLSRLTMHRQSDFRVVTLAKLALHLVVLLKGLLWDSLALSKSNGEGGTVGQTGRQVGKIGSLPHSSTWCRAVPDGR